MCRCTIHLLRNLWLSACLKRDMALRKTTMPYSCCSIACRLVGHFAYCATPLSLMSFKLSKTFNYQPLFFHSPTQNENVKKVQSVFLPNWNWLFLLIFSLFKVEKIKIHDWSTAEVSSWISQLCSSN